MPRNKNKANYTATEGLYLQFVKISHKSNSSTDISAWLDYTTKPLLNYTSLHYKTSIYHSLKEECLQSYSFTYSQISMYGNAKGNGFSSSCKTTWKTWTFFIQGQHLLLRREEVGSLPMPAAEVEPHSDTHTQTDLAQGLDSYSRSKQSMDR